MTSLAIRTIEAIRQEHDTLAEVAAGLSDEQLTRPSGASEWPVAQVLSHLGSGAEISLASLHAALGTDDTPGDDFNRSVWDRWDAMTPVQQRAGFVEHDGRLVEALEALTTEQHESLTVPIGFLPAPLSVAAYAGMRLNEAAHHGWDVRVAFDDTAGLLEAATAVLPEQLAGGLALLLGFAGKADRVDERVVLAVTDGGYSLVIDDSVSLQTATDAATATLAGASEAALRLISGRLGPEHTPGSVAVTGNVTLDELREVFPGF